jgi:hypothetical protein
MTELADARKAIVEECRRIEERCVQLKKECEKVFTTIRFKHEQNCSLFIDTCNIACVESTCDLACLDNPTYFDKGCFELDYPTFECWVNLEDDEQFEETYDLPECECCDDTDACLTWCSCNKKWTCTACIYKVHNIGIDKYKKYCDCTDELEAYFDEHIYGYDKVEDCKPMTDYFAMLHKDNAFFKEAIAIGTKHNYDHNCYGKNHHNNRFDDYSTLTNKK